MFDAILWILVGLVAAWTVVPAPADLLRYMKQAYAWVKRKLAERKKD